MDKLFEIAMPNKIFNFSLQLITVLGIEAMILVEEVVLVFIMEGRKLHRVGPLQVRLLFNLYQDFRFGSKEISVVVRFTSTVAQPGTLSMDEFGFWIWALMGSSQACFFFDFSLISC